MTRAYKTRGQQQQQGQATDVPSRHIAVIKDGFSHAMLGAAAALTPHLRLEQNFNSVPEGALPIARYRILMKGNQIPTQGER